LHRLYMGKHTNKTTKGTEESLLRFLRSCTLIDVDLFILIAKMVRDIFSLLVMTI